LNYNDIHLYLRLEDWKKYHHGFLGINVHVKPKEITDFETCDLIEKEVGFVSPSEKRVIFLDKRKLLFLN
jgi:hypothetical protein